MNNYKLAMDNIGDDIVVDTNVILRERKVVLLKMIGAIDSLSKNKEWQVLKELVFDGAVEKLEKNLLMEVKKNELQPIQIYRLQGQLLWAKRYSDIYKLAEDYKLELNQITKKLNENANF